MSWYTEQGPKRGVSRDRRGTKDVRAHWPQSLLHRNGNRSVIESCGTKVDQQTLNQIRIRKNSVRGHSHPHPWKLSRGEKFRMERRLFRLPPKMLRRRDRSHRRRLSPRACRKVLPPKEGGLSRPRCHRDKSPRTGAGYNEGIAPYSRRPLTAKSGRMRG